MIPWKGLIKVAIWGGIVVIVAPEQAAAAVKGIAQGVGLIISGATDIAVDHATGGVKHFVEGGWQHPTEGAIGWKVIDWVKGWFD